MLQILMIATTKLLSQVRNLGSQCLVCNLMMVKYFFLGVRIKWVRKQFGRVQTWANNSTSPHYSTKTRRFGKY